MGWLSWLHLLFLVYTSQFNCSASIFNSSSSSPPSSGHLCHPDESSALLQFKNSFSIDTSVVHGFSELPPYPRTILWNKSQDCCAWSGVTCERVTSHVIGLNLGYSGLQGNIDHDSSIFSLHHLRKLDLSKNDFKGSPLSSNFGGFVSMTHLDLSNSNFRGRIPLEISYLSKLISLNLYSSRPEMSLQLSLEPLGFKRLVQNLTNLRELSLDQVNMSLAVHDSFMNLSSSLTSLRLHGCNLHGKVPEKTFCLPNLQVLDLAYNYELTGSLPKSNWSNPLNFLGLSRTNISIDLPYMTKILKSLSGLILDGCNFEGRYPALLGNLTQIKTLDLSNNGFRGQIPWSLLNLEGLIYLDLSGNNFVGQLPEVHSKIKTLDLSNNSFSGQIPWSLLNLEGLIYLDLSDNNFVGQLPEVHSNSTTVGPLPWHLTTLKLYGNSLNGTIPSYLYILPSLEELNLSKNQLTGNISEFQSTSLSSLDLSSNNLSGVLEFEKFEKLQNLNYLDLSYNNLSVSFNDFRNFSWPKLRSLYLSSCNIIEFPYFLRASPQLGWINLSHNRIQGNVPTWLLDVGKDSSLTYVNLSHNFLTRIEQLPWMNLEILDLRSNLLQGQLPIPPSYIWEFSVSNNQLTGGLPSTFCSLTFVSVLNLSNNSLSGEIPPCIGDLTKRYLSVLDLHLNKFVGLIPATFAKGNALRNLNLNGNQFEGPLPQSVLNCTQLEVLDLGNNNINDTFPNWLEALPVLQVLILRSNQFHGAIGNPKTRFPFQKLRIMDLSHNQFSGLLPTKYFDNLMGMVNVADELKYMGVDYYHDSVMVAMKGSYIRMEKIQTMFTSIDFSSNGFEGEIPKVISKLKSLKGLNLSHNKLTGPIPPSFSNLTRLEWLDISSNRLVGEIPRQLADLTSLAELNLSENQLVGSIPRGKQFDTFENDSYIGNLGLCGFPLSKTCNNEGADQPPPPSSFEGEDDDLEHENGIDWKTVMMGYGCGIVIGISTGYIVLSNRKVDKFVKVAARELRSKWWKD